VTLALQWCGLYVRGSLTVKWIVAKSSQKIQQITDPQKIHRKLPFSSRSSIPRTTGIIGNCTLAPYKETI
jgi:hypothetical protein